MATVETVTGPVDADQLGTTLVHEHLIYRDEAVATWWPHVGSVVPVDPPRASGPERRFTRSRWRAPAPSPSSA